MWSWTGSFPFAVAGLGALETEFKLQPVER